MLMICRGIMYTMILEPSVPWSWYNLEDAPTYPEHHRGGGGGGR
jgi:hypothetical protein